MGASRLLVTLMDFKRHGKGKHQSAAFSKHFLAIETCCFDAEVHVRLISIDDVRGVKVNRAIRQKMELKEELSRLKHDSSEGQWKIMTAGCVVHQRSPVDGYMRANSYNHHADVFGPKTLYADVVHHNPQARNMMVGL